MNFDKTVAGLSDLDRTIIAPYPMPTVRRRRNPELFRARLVRKSFLNLARAHLAQARTQREAGEDAGENLRMARGLRKEARRVFYAAALEDA